MLEKYTRTTKDETGCEFQYTMCGVYEERVNLDVGPLEKGRHYREYFEKIYIAEFDHSLRANSLKEQN